MAWALLPPSDSASKAWRGVSVQRSPRAALQAHALSATWSGGLPLRSLEGTLPFALPTSCGSSGRRPTRCRWRTLAGPCQEADDIVCLLASMRTEASLIIDGAVCRGYGRAAGEIGALSPGLAAHCTIAPGALPRRCLSLIWRVVSVRASDRRTLALLRDACSLRRIWWSLCDSSVRVNS